MRFRRACTNDADSIRNVVFGVLAEYDLFAGHEGVDADLDDLEANYFARGGTFEVLEDDNGAVVGTAALYPKDDHTCELRKMFLLPAFRGKGHGRNLLNRVLTFARGKGFSRVELKTSSRLVEAISLYQQNGFKPITDRDGGSCCDRAYFLEL